MTQVHLFTEIKSRRALMYADLRIVVLRYKAFNICISVGSPKQSELSGKQSLDTYHCVPQGVYGMPSQNPFLVGRGD